MLRLKLYYYITIVPLDFNHLATYLDMEYTCFQIENNVIVDSVYQEDDKKLFTVFSFLFDPE